MRPRLLLCLTLTFALGAPACDKDGDELLGVWQVTAHTLNDTSCDAEGPALSGPPFIKFIEGEIFGQDYLEYVACTDAAGTSCDEPGGLFGLLYAESIDDGMRAAIYAASGTSSDCLLSSTISTATVSGTALRIETRHRLQDNVSNTACDADDARGTSMPCVELEVITGARP